MKWEVISVLAYFEIQKVRVFKKSLYKYVFFWFDKIHDICHLRSDFIISRFIFVLQAQKSFFQEVWSFRKFWFHISIYFCNLVLKIKDNQLFVLQIADMWLASEILCLAWIIISVTLTLSLVVNILIWS